jgi:DNA-binding NtrC family response regulator
LNTTATGNSLVQHEQQVARYLTVIWSPDSRWNRTVHSFEKQPFAIGRSDALQDEKMSRNHFQVAIRRGVARLEVARPSNGCFLDGRPLLPDCAVPIDHGDIIRAGNTLFIVTADKPGYRFNRTAVVPGRAPEAMRADDYATRVAQTDRHALIIGPSGAGKENVAAQMHALGPRPAANFHRFDCTTLRRGAGMSSFFGVVRGAFTDVAGRDGLLDKTNGGTVFLDEIGDLVPEAEARLLRLIGTGYYERQGGGVERHTDARFVGATLRDVRSPTAMRSDLFHRFTAFQQPIQVPGLHDRLLDLLDWVEVLSEDTEGADTLSAGWVEACLLWDWPGNLRELSSQVRTSRLRAERGGVLLANGLSPEIQQVRQQARLAGPPTDSKRTDPPSDEELIRIWHETGHSISETARRAGQSRRTVRRRLTELGLL